VDDERDLVRWALAAPIPRAQHIGADRVRLVLVALATYADPTGHAWPSAELLAHGIGGLSRRRVREAFDVLEGCRLIKRSGRRGRALRWQLAGIPATSRGAELAGEVAGEVAGNLAGIPATSGVEMEKSQMRPITDDDLATFAQSHPGRERDAVLAARRWFYTRKGEECSNVAAYFGRWSTHELADKIRLPESEKPRCGECDGGGFILDGATQLPVRRCPVCKPAA
jgi:hypothetical protein